MKLSHEMAMVLILNSTSRIRCVAQRILRSRARNYDSQVAAYTALIENEFGELSPYAAKYVRIEVERLHRL